MKMISDYITEQETCIMNTGMDDDYITAYCEAASAMSVANCYAELASLAALAFANDTETSYVQESGDEKPGILSKIGGAMKNAWEGFLRFWKAIIGKVKNFFVEKKVDAVNKKLDDMDPTMMLSIDIRALNPYIFIAFCDTVLDVIQDAEVITGGKAPNDIQWAGKMSKALETVKNGISDGTTLGDIHKKLGEITASDLRLNEADIPEYTVKGQKIEITAGQFKKVVKFFQSERAKKRMDELTRKVDEIEKRMKKTEGGHAETLKKYEDYQGLSNGAKKSMRKHGIDAPDTPDEKYDTSDKLDREAKYHQVGIARLKEIMSETSKLYEGMMSAYNSIANTVLSNPDSVKAKEKTTVSIESAYLV